MRRRQIGTNPVLNHLDNENYLDFIEGMVGFLDRLRPTLTSRADEAIASYVEQTGHPPLAVEDAHAALDALPIVASRNRIRRDIQEMKYEVILDDLRLHQDEILSELDRTDKQGPGSVEYDPS